MRGEGAIVSAVRRVKPTRNSIGRQSAPRTVVAAATDVLRREYVVEGGAVAVGKQR
jgi:hypothetical protein